MGYTGTGHCISEAKLAWMYPTIEKVLRMCGLKPGLNVVIYSDTNRSKEITDAFFAACLNLGTDVIRLMTTPRTGGVGEESRQPPRAAVEMMKKADFVIDLPTNHWVGTPVYSEVLDAGTYMLLSDSDEELIVRIAPTEETIRRTVNGAEMLTEAKTVRIVSRAGTDLTLSVEGRTCNAQTGVVGGNKKWDNFPSSLTEIAPVEDSANGTLVISPGDPIIEFNRLVMDPIKCVLKGGRIVKIEGGADAQVLKEWFEQWYDPNSYVTAHTGFGTHPMADLLSGQAMDWESLYGGINIAFGVNEGRILGGKNRAKSHIDIILRNADFYADDEILIKEGKFVHEALK